MRPQVAPQGTRDRRQHHVVDRAARQVLDPLQLPEVGSHACEAPVGPDLDVERGGGGGEAGARDRTGSTETLDRRTRHLTGRPHERSDTPGDLGRAGAAFDQRLGQELGIRGLRVREPRLGRPGGLGLSVEVEEDRCYVNSGDAVDQAVVGLGDDREATSLDAVHQPDLPHRLAAVEPLREDPRRERSQLLLAARGREGGMADVVVEVQVGIVDPHGTTLAEGDEAQLLAEARHQVKPRGDVIAEVLVGRGRALEQGGRAHVHVGGARLQVEKGGVQPAQPVPVGHDRIISRTREGEIAADATRTGQPRGL